MSYRGLRAELAVGRAGHALEPRSGPEPLEDLLRLGEERFGLVETTRGGQPLAVLGERHSAVERHLQLAEAFGTRAEALLDRAVVSPPGRKPGLEPRDVGTKVRANLTRLGGADDRQNLVRLLAVAEVEGRVGAVDEDPFEGAEAEEVSLGEDAFRHDDRVGVVALS